MSFQRFFVQPAAPEYAETFRAYRNYFEDLASCIGGYYGVADSLVAGVHDAVLAHVRTVRINRKPLTKSSRQLIGDCLCKSWSRLHRIERELADPWTFDEEVNGWLPNHCYYAAYYGVLAYAAASRQSIPRDHRTALNLIAKEIGRGLLPYPWSASCSDGPDTAAITYDGFVGRRLG